MRTGCGIYRNIGAAWILLLASLLLILTGQRTTAMCTLVGPHYRLASETIDWSMRIEGRQNCSRDLNLSRALSSSPGKVEVESVKLVSVPQEGHAVAEGANFSYSPGADFVGRDHFIVIVSGTLNGMHGSSTIRISVSALGKPASSYGTKLPRRGVNASASLNHLSASIAASDTEWSVLKIGAGGYISGASIASDNTLTVRTDTYGAYIWNPNATTPQGNAGGQGAWQQLVTSSSMPASFVNMAQLYGQGVYEIAISPSNSNYIYMMYPIAQASTFPPNITVYQSTNKGKTWSTTNFTPVSELILNSNDSFRFYGQKMVVDPNSPTTVFASGGTTFWKTTNGGSSWTRITGGGWADPASAPYITGIAINPSNSNEVVAASHGNGVYHSTDGGSNWTKFTTGTGPSDVGFGVVNSGGTYFACDMAGNPNLWTWNGTTWAKKITGTGAGTQCDGIAINPSNQNWIRASSIAGTFAESTDGGITWSNFSDYGIAPKIVANDVPWLTKVFSNTLYNRYGLLWDQANSSAGKMIIPTARGVFTTTLAQGITSSTVTTTYSQNVGIEQLNATQIIIPPTGAGATPIACVWDSPVFQPDMVHYPSTFYPVADNAVFGCWSVDYASSSPSTFVINTDNGYLQFSALNRSAICTVGGSCTLFSSIGSGLPSNAFPTAANQWGGDIAASAPNNIIFAPGSSGNHVGTNPSYTTDGGVHWNAISIPGVANWADFRFESFGQKPTHSICADRVNATTFYLLFPGSSAWKGLYYSTNGGANWKLASSATISVGQGHDYQMHCTPGQGGDVWIATGADGNAGSQPIGGGNLYHITNANTDSPTITTCANVQEPYDVGFGKAKPGNNYPSIYIVGWVGTIPRWGVWRSDDQCATWTQLNTWLGTGPGSMDKAASITGDPNSYNRVFIGTGSGFIWRQF
jgi:hypothetical protein